MKRYQAWFDIVEGRENAEHLRDQNNSRMTAYMRKHHPSYITSWKSKDEPEKDYYVVFTQV